MAEHASDCELHNAPAKAPGPCSCGASMRFRLFGYNINADVFGWRTFSRETLIAEAVGGALGRHYGKQRLVRASTLIARAVTGGFGANERDAIAKEWANIWEGQSGGDCASALAGNPTPMSAEDGRYLSPADYPNLTAAPEDAEISAALAPWIEFWAALPEPVPA